MAERHPLVGALDKLTRPPVLTLLGGLQLALMLVVVAAHLGSLEPPGTGTSDLGTGDFLAFWTGANLVYDGQGASLYDFDAQREVQAGIVGVHEQILQGYLNPPGLALVLSATVPLGYLASFYLFDGASAALFALAMVLLLGEIRHLAPRPLDRITAVLMIASFHPVLRTMFGGQNTTITLSLLSILYVAVRRGWWPVAALMLGLLTYKPQYAIGMGVALVAAREWRVVAGGVAVGFAHWGAGAIVCGPAWPLRMLEGMRVYGPWELAANAHTHFSWVRATDFVLPTPLDTLAAIVGAVVVLGLMAFYGRSFGKSDIGYPAFWALAVLGTMLVSPHLQYYDAGLLVLPTVLLLDHVVARDGRVSLVTRIAVAVAYAGYPAYELALQVGFQPLAVALVGLFIWAAWSVYRAGQRTVATA